MELVTIDPSQKTFGKMVGSRYRVRKYLTSADVVCFTRARSGQFWVIAATSGHKLIEPNFLALNEFKSICAALWWTMNYFLLLTPFLTEETLLAFCCSERLTSNPSRASFFGFSYSTFYSNYLLLSCIE